MDFFDDNESRTHNYNGDFEQFAVIIKKQWRTMLIASIAVIVVLLIIGYFIFATLLTDKINAANQAYEDAVNNYKRVFYLPEDYTTAALSVTSQRLDSVVEIYCVTTIGGVTVSGSASGFIITDDGYVITNNHVVTYEANVPIYNRFGIVIGYRTEQGIHSAVTANFIDSSNFYKTNGYKLNVIETFAEQDLALLKFDSPPQALISAPFGNSALITIGEEAIIIGNAQSYGLALTTGVISNPNRAFIEAGSSTPLKVLQTDAALNPGNSGGPVFNIFGEVIGVVSFKVQEEYINEGLGFAILSNTAMEFIDRVASEKSLNIAYTLTERGE